MPPSLRLVTVGEYFYASGAQATSISHGRSSPRWLRSRVLRRSRPADKSLGDSLAGSSPAEELGEGGSGPALADQPPGQLGYEGQPGNQGGALELHARPTVAGGPAKRRAACRGSSYSARRMRRFIIKLASTGTFGPTSWRRVASAC